MYDMLVLCTAPNWWKAPKQFRVGNVICSRVNSYSVRTKRCYHSLFPLFNNHMGCIYHIYPQDTPLTEFECCDYMLEMQYKNPHTSREMLFEWVNIPENACAIAHASILAEWEKQFEAVLQRLIGFSRIGRIAFLLVGQGRWLELQEITVGTFALETFMNKMKDGSILSGIIYFVSKSLEKAFEDDEWVLMEDVLQMPDSDLAQEGKEE